MTRSPLTYNLKAVIHETGLSPATLRAWERRYGLIKPERSAGGHRLYSENDIKLLKWLVARQAEGLSISQAVARWRSLGLGEESQSQSALPQVGGNDIRGTALDEYRSNWIRACLQFNEQEAEQVLAQAFSITVPETVSVEVLQKGLAEIGEGWYEGDVSVQQEHFASALAMRRLNALFAAVPAPTRNERILAACPPGEQHEFALLLIAYLLRRRGWDVIYLGADVAIEHLAATLQAVEPRLLVAAAQTLTSAASLCEMANEAAAHQIPTVYGGRIFNQLLTLTGSIPGYYLGSDLSVVPQRIESLFAQTLLPAEVKPLSPQYHQLLDKFVAHRALIVAKVTARMQSLAIEAAHIETANLHFTNHILAALRLGDIHYLDYPAGWLAGLLENNGLPPSMASRYYAVYRWAVEAELGREAAPVLDWLHQFEQQSL